MCFVRINEFHEQFFSLVVKMAIYHDLHDYEGNCSANYRNDITKQNSPD